MARVLACVQMRRSLTVRIAALPNHGASPWPKALSTVAEPCDPALPRMADDGLSLRAILCLDGRFPACRRNRTDASLQFSASAVASPHRAG
ncbi:hypothetical protein H681_20285 [Pseudomonas sp. ATCC 13867]|nr:hypothetical protein H681_20285 [Pseudomonas sp. ATCC 13867]